MYVHLLSVCLCCIVQLLSVQRQAELLLQRQASLTATVAAATEKLDSLTTQRAAAQYDVELQMRLKQGQVGDRQLYSCTHIASAIHAAGAVVAIGPYTLSLAFSPDW